MQKYLDIFAALLALAAAIFWFLSAYGRLPPILAYWGETGTPENDPFYSAVKYSAKMNRWAATLSGLSALCMGVQLFIR